AIEIISYCTRPISLSVRLFANMLAGHIMMKVFASFIIMMASAGAIGLVGGIVPFTVNVLLTGLEILVAGLQAFVFTILTCIYLNDALHPGH
ncbi:MAG: F0F1 ATP synthase subunit A, partial [Kordiimonadaceae bacterium]|nr:F0F1 ATP synthase subunit A [Kordiimonadaceae bacterium]